MSVLSSHSLKVFLMATFVGRVGVVVAERMGKRGGAASGEGGVVRWVNDRKTTRKEGIVNTSSGGCSDLRQRAGSKRAISELHALARSKDLTKG
jgi:hypothetical protein